MDTGFFAKVGAASAENELSEDTIQQLKALVQAHPELLAELLKGTGGDATPPDNT